MPQLLRELIDGGWHHRSLLIDWPLLELHDACDVLPKPEQIHEHRVESVAHQLHRHLE
jgi:hypothetical protein